MSLGAKFLSENSMAGIIASALIRWRLAAGTAKTIHENIIVRRTTILYTVECKKKNKKEKPQNKFATKNLREIPNYNIVLYIGGRDHFLQKNEIPYSYTVNFLPKTERHLSFSFTQCFELDLCLFSSKYYDHIKVLILIF